MHDLYMHAYIHTCIHAYIYIYIYIYIYMSSTTTWLLRGAAPPLVVLVHVRWQGASKLCSTHSGHCNLFRSVSPTAHGEVTWDSAAQGARHLWSTHQCERSNKDWEAESTALSIHPQRNKLQLGRPRQGLLHLYMCSSVLVSLSPSYLALSQA